MFPTYCETNWIIKINNKRNIPNSNCQQHNTPFNSFKQESINCECKNKDEPVDSQHYIDKAILLKRMQQFGMEVDTNDIGMLIEMFDSSQKNRISYSDFISQLFGKN